MRQLGMKKAIYDAPERTLFTTDLVETLTSQTGERKRCLDYGVPYKLHRELQHCGPLENFPHLGMSFLVKQLLFELSVLHVSNPLPTLLLVTPI